MSAVNLNDDDLFGTKSAEADSVGNELVGGLAPTAKKDTRSVDDVFDAHQKILFLVDTSGSMASLLSGTDEDAEDHEDDESDKDAGADEKAPSDRYLSYKSAIAVVRESAADFIGERFRKYPNAKVGLASFEHSFQLLADIGCSKEQLLLVTQSLVPGGGTNFRAALTGASAALTAKKGLGGMHIVMVSDGDDSLCYSQEDLKAIREMLVKEGIVLDFLFISDRPLAAVEEAFTGLTGATGGEFVRVSSSSQFRKKFFQVSGRLCLPPKR